MANKFHSSDYRNFSLKGLEEAVFGLSAVFTKVSQRSQKCIGYNVRCDEKNYVGLNPTSYKF